jgi:hypothetical protein
MTMPRFAFVPLLAAIGLVIGLLRGHMWWGLGIGALAGADFEVLRWVRQKQRAQADAQASPGPTDQR